MMYRAIKSHPTGHSNVSRLTYKFYSTVILNISLLCMPSSAKLRKFTVIFILLTSEIILAYGIIAMLGLYILFCKPQVSVKILVSMKHFPKIFIHFNKINDLIFTTSTHIHMHVCIYTCTYVCTLVIGLY